MSKSSNIRRQENCLNCNHPLNEHAYYCPNCGQKALHEDLTFKYFFNEFISNVFSIDSKLVRTLKNLISKPSFLTLEFINGRRIRYINPIQLFLFSSFLYFLINSFMFLKENAAEQDFFTVTDGNENLVIDSLEIEQADSLYIIGRGSETDTLNNSFIGKFLQKGKAFNNLDQESQNEKISTSISYAVFLLMPIFALYLMWFYKRKQKHYLENLIFSLHFHSFYYFLGVIFLFADKLLPGDFQFVLLNLLVLVYLVLALRKFYLFSWKSTILRFLGLIVLYGFTVSIFLIASILLSILFL